MCTRTPPFKNGHRELLKKYIHVFFRPCELKIVLKRGDFTVSAYFGPVLRGQNSTSKTLKINVSRLRKCHPHQDSREHGTRGCFLITQIPGTPKTTLGAHCKVGLSVGGLFLKKPRKSPKRGQNEPFWPFLPFWGPKFVLNLPFLARFSVRRV